MIFQPYHNIVGGTTRENELIGIRDLKSSSVKSIHLNNIHTSSAASINLYIYKPSTDSTTEETYYLLYNYALAAKTFLVLDDKHALGFDNNKYSMFIEVGASDTVDVLIGI